MNMKPETLTKLIYQLGNTRAEEIGCDTCYEELHRFADMLKRGDDPAKVMPMVQHHLEMCTGCDEEFSAFMQSIEAVDAESN